MKFRKKPVVVDAIQWDGTNDAFTQISRLGTRRVTQIEGDNALWIETLEGTMKANSGDWIIKGVAGEIYPCKPDIFEKTYEPMV